MFSNIKVEELIPLYEKNEMVLIDVRSPSEYREFTIPGSMNIPFFTDEERAEIGTIYKQVSVEAAKERGLEIISAKLPSFVRQFKEIKGPKTVYCWRGGMRSKTTATLLDLMNIHVNRLDGGIRAYRNWVVQKLQQLEESQASRKAFILNGLTGTGKTRILKALEKEGYPVIDLEGLANHKGSIFGHVGLTPRNQKSFDSRLVHRLDELKDAPYLLFEAESSRIGKSVLPHFIREMKDRSPQLVIKMPIEERIKIILGDYHPEDFQQQNFLAAYARIKSRIHTPIAKQIEEDISAGRFESAVSLLLEHYYDLRYKGLDEYPDSEKTLIEASNLEEAIQAVKALLPSPVGQKI